MSSSSEATVNGFLAACVVSYLRLLIHHLPPKNHRFMDAANDGFVDRPDLEASLKTLGIKASGQVERMIDYCLAQRVNQSVSVDFSCQS